MKKYVGLMLSLLPLSASAVPVPLSWDATVNYIDNTPIEATKNVLYRVSCWFTPTGGALTQCPQPIKETMLLSLTYDVTSTVPGDFSFRVQSIVDSLGSDYSSRVIVPWVPPVVLPKKPMAPSGFKTP